MHKILIVWVFRIKMLEDRVEEYGCYKEYKKRIKEINDNALKILIGCGTTGGLVTSLATYFFGNEKILCFPTFIVGGFFGLITGLLLAEEYTIRQYKKLDEKYRNIKDYKDYGIFWDRG